MTIERDAGVWHPIAALGPPRDCPILVTDGKQVTATRLVDWGPTTDGRRGTFMHGVAFGGYEWEYDFDLKDVTHWMSMPRPPK